GPVGYEGEPSARALTPADGVWGAPRSGADVGAERAQRASTGRAPRYEGGRARERSSRPTGSGGRGGAARTLERSARSARAPDGPPDMREAERESARAGRRGLGASEARRARSARALDG